MSLSAAIVPGWHIAIEWQDFCCQVKAALDEGSVPLYKFIITKQLTKQPSQYPDAASQPHVQVALRRRAANMRSAASQVDFCWPLWRLDMTRLDVAAKYEGGGLKNLDMTCMLAEV